MTFQVANEITFWMFIVLFISLAASMNHAHWRPTLAVTALCLVGTIPSLGPLKDREVWQMVRYNYPGLAIARVWRAGNAVDYFADARHTIRCGGTVGEEYEVAYATGPAKACSQALSAKREV
jgi:hypothetical protein